ncbi:hypothetical protein [Lacticaseibacillus manihotivorans]|uniref:DUF1642 domain-containing protein n=1 Tax=Lacticaseibacillus manihotivorans TaxID=88233 RepID=A0A5P8JQK1_9LACO|nr:hypothetical protein [Lacticaseibacillus manihotivorans]QFQ90999.1 hypothetical protein LM010_05975 [Lacticaseibacillus manihotivorans]
MSNETKRDVFEKIKSELISNLANTIYQNGGLMPLEDATKVGENYATRYAAALPDDLPVIPEAVGDAIKIHKDYAHSLLDIFGALSIYGVSRTEPSLDYNAWIVHHADTFARAWVLGAWYVEESGEIVKLEAED